MQSKRETITFNKLIHVVITKQGLPLYMQTAIIVVPLYKDCHDIRINSQPRRKTYFKLTINKGNQKVWKQDEWTCCPP